MRANIAESCGRFHKKDRVNFLYHARGSLIETEHHLIVANKLGYLSENELMRYQRNIKKLAIKLNDFINTLK